MTAPARQKQRTGLSPEWAKLPKRHCDNCNTLYKPVKPLREGERGFCKANCRKEYHKHGGAYRKLKAELEKMIERRLREVIRQEIERHTEQARKDAEFSEIISRPGW